MTGVRIGEAVFGICDGGFAEYARAAADTVVTMPTTISAKQAAAVPTSGATALQTVRDVGRVSPGQRALIIGAGGGVGAFATQLARTFGAEVTGVCGPAKAELVRSLGATVLSPFTSQRLRGLVAITRRADLLTLVPVIDRT
ncbi:hypothetical protein GCM10010201_25880 [Pilimelia columellifera subsp. columellifera]|uniref:Uncharacterized protein n=1 Tax=Pilimelia columellifera subsp. columellifera TaxID=706583 RepID=A0ABP6AWN9_9ACTN